MRSLAQPRKIIKEYQDFTSVFEESSERTTMLSGDENNRMSDTRLGSISVNKGHNDSPPKGNESKKQKRQSFSVSRNNGVSKSNMRSKIEVDQMHDLKMKQ